MFFMVMVFPKIMKLNDFPSNEQRRCTLIFADPVSTIVCKMSLTTWGTNYIKLHTTTCPLFSAAPKRRRTGNDGQPVHDDLFNDDRPGRYVSIAIDPEGEGGQSERYITDPISTESGV